MFGFSREEMRVLRRLDTPRKVQDFLNTLRINFDDGNDTCMSPRVVLRKGKCHCIEAAMLACAALRVHGHRPLVVDLEANSRDLDHVICVFRQGGKWGAISKSNHAFLRYRDPVYRDIRELVMSYFNEYIDDNGAKTLRKYSSPVGLSMFDKIGWMTAEHDVWEIADYLAKAKHHAILARKQIAGLRKSDCIEKKALKIVEWRNRRSHA